jgi:hypothetical protein
MKNIFALVIALVVIGMTVAPQVQAQTAAQQRELEQIAKRSMNGLSPQDRKRVVEIMTDMLMKQGMTRQQAAAFAEANADTLFITDIDETSNVTPEQRQQLEEQERADQRARQYQPPPPARMPGTAGWPAAPVFSRYGKTIAKPNVQGFFSYEKTGDKLVIHIWKTQEGAGSIEHFTGAEYRTVQAAVKSAFGDESWGRLPDPQRKNAGGRTYYIEFSLEAISSGQIMTITIEPGSNEDVQ